MLKWLLSKASKTSSSPVDKYDLNPGAAFGVRAGRFVGEFFVYIECVDNVYQLLSLPNMQIRQLTVAQYKTGIDNNIIEYQETLPTDVFKACLAQYKHAKKSNN
jgi:hypothetical protein